MRNLFLAAIGLGSIVLLYLSLVPLSSGIAKYDYCYDTALAAKYNLNQPDFTEYGLKSKPKCTQ